MRLSGAGTRGVRARRLHALAAAAGLVLTGLGFASEPAAPRVAPRMLLLDGAQTGSDLIAVGERGTILRSTDPESGWHRVASPTRATLTGVSFATLAAPRLGWAVGHDALILATTDGGRTWVKQYQGEDLQDSFLDVLALDAQRVIAVGAYGLARVTTNGGRTWEKRTFTDEDTHFNRITRGPSGTLYLAGERGTLLRSADRGETWRSIAAPYEGSFYGVLPLDGRTLVAHGLRGHIYHSADDGASWRLVATPEPVLLAAGIRMKGNHLVFAGQARALLVSRDHGKSVTSAPGAPATGVAELLELPDGRLLALGEGGATLLPKP
jgi:photosystem II stability/assembly factor-like uncharacterized protein